MIVVGWKDKATVMKQRAELGTQVNLVKLTATSSVVLECIASSQKDEISSIK